jgi:hypothetical protein
VLAAALVLVQRTSQRRQVLFEQVLANVLATAVIVEQIYTIDVLLVLEHEIWLLLTDCLVLQRLC